jgi:hypothetical protein
LLHENQIEFQGGKDQDELKRMRQLESSFNPNPTELVEHFEQGRKIPLDQANIV